ncbi:MAG: winged helix-turn-helix transcriptional regulator [Acidobacteria bacterium]|nr:winged helix-turn-helix transcriptional regulator [Acidobacteriota bacterium]
MANHDQHYRKILLAIETGEPVTQRSLSRELGIALGLANQLVKRMVEKGFIKTDGTRKGKKTKYVLTPKGVVEKTRLSTAYLENTIGAYKETREKIRQSLDQIVPLGGGAGKSRQRVVFYGAGEVAEIAYITLNDSVFELVGVVDDNKRGERFFGHLIGSPDQLADRRERNWYDRIVVTTFKKSKDIRKRIENLRIPLNKISFL